MSAARKLRAVRDDETAPQAPMTVLDAAEHGERRDVLAALSRRILEVDREIREIDLARAERERQTATEATEDEDGLGDI